VSSFVAVRPGLTTAKAQQAATATGGSATVVEEPFRKTGLYKTNWHKMSVSQGLASKPNEISRWRRTAISLNMLFYLNPTTDY
jgi:hypothetical protein